MALRKYKLGELLEMSDEKNDSGKYTVDDVRGISIKKVFIETKADMGNVSLKPYQPVHPDDFAYVTVTSRNGEKITLAHNTGDKTLIVSSSYVVFRVKKTDVLNSDYLFMYFNRPEFDRYARFNSWGSARETFSWEDLCDVEIDLPPLTVQEKYVAVYQAMLANQSAYEKGLDDLKLACDALVEEQKQTCRCESVMRLLREVEARNADCKIREISGINIDKQFMPSTADVDDKALANYKIVSKGQFAYSSMQTGRDKCIRIALQRESDPKIVSPAYFVFEVSRDDVLPEWIMLWFMRKETDRRGWFLSDSSVRANLDLDRLAEVMIPLPDKQVQEEIVGVFESYLKSIDIAQRFKELIQQACPILIRGSLDEAAVGNVSGGRR